MAGHIYAANIENKTNLIMRETEREIEEAKAVVGNICYITLMTDRQNVG